MTIDPRLPPDPGDDHDPYGQNALEPPAIAPNPTGPRPVYQPPGWPAHSSASILAQIAAHSYHRRKPIWPKLLVAVVAIASLAALGLGFGGSALFTRPAKPPASDEKSRDDSPPASAETDEGQDSALNDSAEGPDPTVTPVAEDENTPDDSGTPTTTTVTVEAGDTLNALLTRAGIERSESFAAITALREQFTPKSLQVGQEIALTLSPGEEDDGGLRLLAMAFDADVDRRVVVERGDDGRFTSHEEVKNLKQVNGRIAAVIDDSLYGAANKAGLPDTVTASLIQAFSYDVDFQREIQPGDQLDVLVERFQDDQGTTLKWGNVLYARLVLKDNDYVLYHYAPKGEDADYFNPKGESVRKALLRTPIDGARLSSTFGMRKHPVLGFSRMHKGVDFAAPTGTPILAAGDGVIDKIGLSSGYGNYIRLKHNPQYSTAYGHMSRFAKALKPGSKVRQGQVIGYVGMTGLATGPHLHYEVIDKGVQVNPLGVRFKSGTVLAGKDLKGFQGFKQQIDQELHNAPMLTAAASPPPDRSDDKNGPP